MRKFLFPSLSGYNLKWLRMDVMAAIVVATIAIPQSLGYAVIVGVPVQAGLYCALLAPIIFAVFASSKRLIVGADSAAAVLVAAGAATVAVVGTPEYSGAIALLGLLTAAILLFMSAARFGFLADLISQPVLIGFLSGVGIQLMITQLPGMLGLHATGDIFAKLGYVVTHFMDANWPTVVLSVVALAIILIATKFKWPGALMALIAAIVATKLFNLESLGIAVIGAVPAGLPSFKMPPLSVDMALSLLVPAASIAIVVLTQSLAVIRSSAARHDEKVNDNQDLMSLGLANAASAVTGGFAINGSPPRTSAAEMAGGRSQLVNVFMALVIACVLLFATGLFQYVPAACLAAVVCSIGLHLVKVKELRDIFAVRRSEFAIALAALSGVAVLGVQKGIMIAVIISLVERLHRQYRPHDELLLRDQQFGEWAAERLGGDTSRFDAPAGLLVYRFSDALFFENVGYFLSRAQSMLADAKEPVKYFVLDASAVSDIDYTAAKALSQFHNQLNSDDIQLVIAHVHPRLRKLLKRYGLIDLIGKQHIHSSVRIAIEKYVNAHTDHVERIKALGLARKNYIVISGTAMELMGLRSTNDVDLVVSKTAYNKLRDHNWKEFVLDDGKKVLSRHGYKIMMHWMGHDLERLQKNAQEINGIPVIGSKDLIDCKKRMGREKDLADIRSLEHMVKVHENHAKDSKDPKTWTKSAHGLRHA